jgi:hypothetical protein
MHRYARGAFADTQSCRSRRIIDGCMRDGQKPFEHSKFTCLAGRFELGRQAINGKFEQCKSPLPVENGVGGNLRSGIGGVTALGKSSVNRQVNRSAAIPWP